MNKELTNLKQDFNEKVSRLENVRIKLKTEFTGIDKAIDEVVDNILSWYTLAEIQTQPTVINLWGLTGVGKTSLLMRIAELLEIKDKSFRIDLGVKHGSNSFDSIINEVGAMSNAEPVMIILDEFQHARTVRMTLSGNKEVENSAQRQLWDLLDSGKIIQNSWRHIIFELIKYIKTMNMLINRKVRVENGLVVEEKELFVSEIHEAMLLDSELEECWAVPSTLHFGRFPVLCIMDCWRLFQSAMIVKVWMN